MRAEEAPKSGEGRVGNTGDSSDGRPFVALPQAWKGAGPGGKLGAWNSARQRQKNSSLSPAVDGSLM